jgi:hypothetical protein
MSAVTSILLGLADLSNPVTPWVVLVLCAAGWLALYLMLTARNEP